MNPDPFVVEVAECRSAQQNWASTSFRQRRSRVCAVRHLLVDRADELTAAVEADVQRPPNEVLGSDILPTAAACQFLVNTMAQLLKPRRVGGPPLWLFGQRDAVHHRPWGVVGIIGTWNYPIYLNAIQIVQALAAGNGVLWKPSEHGGASARVLHRLFLDAGFPAALFHLLPAERDAGPRLLESDIDHLVFTGSAGVGRKIAVRCAERMIPSTLELSGVDAMFVLDDADLDLAAKAAWFGMTLNRGQTCLAVRRIFVPRGIHDGFADRLRPLVEGSEPLTLVTRGQVDQAERLLVDAMARGGQVVPAAARQGAGAGAGILPTLVLRATPDMELCRTDCFAPIAAILPYDDLDHAVAMDRQCPFGLGASVFTQDRSKAKALAERLRTGSVSMNDVIAPTAHPATPFGGRGASGWGVTQGSKGLLAMTVPQVVSHRRGKWRPHFDGPSGELGELLRGLLRWTHGSGLRQRFGGLWQTISAGRKLK